MLKNLQYTLILSFFISFSAFAQKDFCGTAPYKSPELIEFQSMEGSWVNMRADDTLYVNLACHIVGRDDGSSYTNMESFFQQMCETNAVYEEFGVVFYISDLNYINDSRYSSHENTRIGGEMMREHKIDGAINLFFVNDPAGYCGYYMPSTDCIAIGNGCMAPGSYTWAHELGHLFSLPHTFYGWEGIDYQPGRSTPDMVGRTPTERVDGSNCTEAGDGFCDTPPDYLSYRWPCTEDSMSRVRQFDINKESFFSDGKLLMSYSNKGCRGTISPEQQQAIKYNILETRQYDVRKPTNQVFMHDPSIKNISPAMDEEVYFDNVSFSWDPVEGAALYLLEYTKFDVFNYHSTKVYLTEPHFTPDTIYPSWTHIQWRVKPYGIDSYCVDETSETFQFSTKVTSTENLTLTDSRTLYPNPIKPTEELFVYSDNGFTGKVQVMIFNATGNPVRQFDVNQVTGNKLSLQLNNVNPGMHYVQIITDEGKSNHKIIILP